MSEFMGLVSGEYDAKPGGFKPASASLRLPAHLSGKLQPIGIASAKRVAAFDTVPTLAEQGLKGFEA